MTSTHRTRRGTAAAARRRATALLALTAALLLAPLTPLTPPGIGKTTLAYVVSQATQKRFVELSAITAGVKEVRAVIDGARRSSGAYGRETVLF
ncbi:AAA family ATPase, partial [Streptomyces sp. NPDC059853]|uniref:AAA family ATPase n=1 Tax=Streptomyces sp. NPDC059853 TaxID=3346973 RepID=UPI00366135B5